MNSSAETVSVVNSMKLFIPLPKEMVIRKPLANVSKIKYYTEADKVPCVASEMQKLNNEHYTHAVNMPGPLAEIFYYASRLNVIVLDSRTTKYVADICAAKGDHSPTSS